MKAEKLQKDILQMRKDLAQAKALKIDFKNRCEAAKREVRQAKETHKIAKLHLKEARQRHKEARKLLKEMLGQIEELESAFIRKQRKLQKLNSDNKKAGEKSPAKKPKGKLQPKPAASPAAGAGAPSSGA